MKARHLLLLLLIFTLFAPIGCEKQETTLEIIPETQPPVDKGPILVNISSKTVHLDAECRYGKNADEDNLRRMEANGDDIHILFSMGYTLCRHCSKQDE